LQLLEFCRAIVGLPTLVTLVLSVFTANTKIVATGTLAALGVALALFFFPRLRFLSKPFEKHTFFSTLPWLFTAVLAVVLVLVIVPSRAKKQNNLLANSWLNWQKELEKSASRCGKGDAQCLAKALSPVIETRPKPFHETDATGLASDLLAGQLMLANDNARDLLNKRLSIGEKFVGSGFSEPVGQINYTAARVPEYLVPNLNDQSSYVWVWQLDREQVLAQKPIMDNKLLDVLLKVPPTNHADFARNWPWASQHQSSYDPRPLLVRFALFDPSKIKYSGCLGRADATRVFMTSLGDVSEKTVQDAAQSSGYTVPPKADAPGLKLFIWVYAPTGEGQATPATWGNVLGNFGTWVTAEPCASAH